MVSDQYFVFAGLDYDHLGGWDDFMGSAKTIEEARKLLAEEQFDWYHIIDIHTQTCILRGRGTEKF